MTTKEASSEGGNIEIVDQVGADIRYVDWLASGGVYNDMVHVSLGALDRAVRDGKVEGARVIVSTNLRMTRSFAEFLHKTLGNMLGQAAPEGTPPPQAPPKNMIN